MASCFVHSFASVYSRDVPNNPFPHQACSSEVEQLSISPELVEKAIESLNINSSMGDDNIHPRLLHALKRVLSLPLSLIFVSTINSGVLPSQWLNSIVIPIYNKSFRYDPLNYRPVSLTSVPCKLLEKLLVNHISEYLEDNHLLSDHQYGFRSKYSTVDQLISTYNDITTMVDQGKIVDLVFFDYSKAFDSVCHSTLLVKLQQIGIRGYILEWIRGFLTGRMMRVRVNGVLSEPVSVASGVPQGSVLGPLLFLIYVNYVIYDIPCFSKVFADDTKLYLGYSRDVSNPSVASFQQCIDKLVNESISWGLRMNASKCVVMRFCSNSPTITVTGPSPYNILGNQIYFVPSHSDLGVVVDRNLKFHSHINRKAAMANNLTTNLLSCTICRDKDFLMNLYMMHLRPLLEYASSLWNLGYVGDLRVLERVQRRWTRSVTGFEDLSYGERLRRLDLFSFQGRLLRADLILVYKILHQKCAIDPVDVFLLREDGTTRGHDLKLFKPRTRLETRKRFFSVRVIDLWNNLSNDTVTSESVNQFKANLKHDLGALLYEFV